MNWNLLLPLLVTTVVAVLGWTIAHRLAVGRDHRNKKREVRVRFLLDAYQRLEAGASRGQIHGTKIGEGFESAVADVQLLGTAEQSAMARDVAMAIASRAPDASVGPLLITLRDDLRRELDLDPVRQPPIHFRLTTGDGQKRWAASEDR